MVKDKAITRMQGGRFLTVGIVALLLIGYAYFAGPLGSAQPPGGAQPAVELAKADLADRKGIDKEQITVVSVKAMDWPDASLGCPQEGMMYAQVITPGYMIVLSHEGETYQYHSDRGVRVVYCEQE